MADMDRILTGDKGPVLTCKVLDCSYNQFECCYAAQIEVGDDHPRCDTYTHEEAGAKSDIAIVSQCHVQECYFNDSEICHAAGITVGVHRGHADCMTART
jgi:hypothetical protein